MADNYTSEVRIGTRLDNSGIRKDITKTEKEIDRLTSSFDRQVASIKKQEDALSDMRRELESIVKGETEPKALKDMESKLKSINAETRAVEAANQDLIAQYEAAVSKLEELRQVGFTEDQLAPQIAEVDRLAEQLRPIDEELQTIRDRAREVEDSISAIRLDPSTSSDAQILRDRIQDVSASIEDGRRNANELNTELLMTQARQGVERASSAFKKFGNGILKALSGLKLFNKENKNTGKGARSATTGIERFTKRVLRLAAAVFVFNIIRKAMNALREQIGALLMANEDFVRSWNNIRVNLLTAFAPLWQVIQPALISFMQTLEQVTYALARFVAALFGKTYEQAKDAAEAMNDQADAIKNAGNAADKAGKKLARFDTIQQQTTDTAKDGLDFDIVAPDDTWWSRFLNFLEKAKSIFDDILNVIKAAWGNEGLATLDAFKRMLNSIWELIKVIGSTWLEVWTDGHGQALVESLLRFLQMIFNVIADIANAFTEAWKRGDVGKILVQRIFEMFTNILDLLTSWGNAFRVAWNEGELGILIMTNILQIATGIVQIVSNIALKLREAWEANNNGVRIWQAILGFVNDILSTINRMTAATVDWVKNLNLEPLTRGFSNLLEAIRKVASIIIDALGWAYINVLLPFAKWLAELFVPAALNLLAAGFNVISAVLKTAKPLFEWLWGSFLQPLGKWAGEIIIKALDLIANGLQKVADWISKNGKLIEDIIIVIGSFVAAWLVVNGAVTVFNTVMGIAKTAIGLVKGAFALLTSPIGLVALAIGSLIAIIVLLVKNWDTVKEVATKTWESIKNTWNGVATWFNTTVVNPIKNFFDGLWKGIGDAARNTVEGMKKLFEGLATVIKAPFQSVANLINGILKIITSAVNFLIGALNNLKFTIPDWVPGVGGKKFEFNIPKLPDFQIPKLADGAVIPPNAPFAAILGDNRREPEIVSPLSKMEEAVENVLTRIGGIGGGSRTAIFEVNGREFARATYDDFDSEGHRRGIRMATV